MTSPAPALPAAAEAGLLSPQRERAVLRTLAGIHFTHIVDFMVMMPLGPILMHEFALDARAFGLLVSAYTFTAAASGLVAAAFIDRFERKSMLLWTFALFIVATLACGLAPGFATLLVARCAAGAFGGVLGAIVLTVVGDLIPFARRGRASGTIMAAFSASTVAGVPLSLMLASAFGWRVPFLCIAALSLLLLALGWRELPRLDAHVAVPVAGADAGHPLAAMQRVLADGNCRRALLFMSLVIASGFTVIPFITIYTVANVGIAQAQVPLIYLCGGLASFFTARWIGRLADLHGKVRVYRLVALASIVPLLLQTHLPPLPLALVLLCTTSFFVLVPGRMVPAMAIVTSAVPPPLRGTFMSLNASMQQLASGAAAFGGGLLIATGAGGRLIGYELTGYVAVAATLVALFAVGGIRLPAEHKNL